jgi:[ribosomal protein S5]-alanine N-acetyltransferase
VGYRVGEQTAGRGVATAAVHELCVVAARLGLSTLTAAASHQNIASQRVLIKVGFVPDGPADPAELGGEHGSRFRPDLVSY